MTLTVVRDGAERQDRLAVLDGGVELPVWSAGASVSRWNGESETPSGYEPFTEQVADSVGSWWQLPRAVEQSGYLYGGGVTRAGEVHALKTDLRTGLTEVKALRAFTVPDDHNNPAVLAQPGKPLVVAVTEHNGATYVYRESTTGTLSTLAQVGGTLSWPSDASYMQLYRLPGTDRLVLLTRSGDANERWYWRVSEDYGTTWAAAQLIITAADNKQFYLATVQVGSRLRCVGYGHPSLSSIHSLGVFSLDLTNGSIDTLDGGAPLGTVGTGISSSAPPLAYTAPGGTSSRLFDIGAGAEPEVVFATWTGNGAASYRYARAGNGWTPRTLALAGATIGDSLDKRYLGGMSLPNPTPGGTVYLSREDAGTWRLEKHTTTDGGATWVTRQMQSSTRPLARPYCPVGRTISGPEVVLNELTRYASFTDYAGRAVAL